MRNSALLISLLSVVGAATFIPAQARAESFSLHLEPSFVQPLTKPQSDIYSAGPGLEAKGLFKLHPNFSLGPTLSAIYLPRWTDNGQNAGVLWQGGVAFRAEGNRELPETNQFARVSPWVDLDAMVAHTGDLWRPSVDVGVGLEAAMDKTHSFWFGPFLRYTHVFQTGYHDGAVAIDRNDVNMFQAGVSFSFDFPVRPSVRYQVRTITHEKVKFVPINSEVVIVRDAPVSKPETLSLTQHVYFDFDKAVLRWESADKLNEIVAKLQKFPSQHIHVQGHASSDGQKAHNEKLAAARAEAVRSYLVAHGIDNSRLSVDNFGVDRPAADNRTQEGRERSRRVEFELTFTTN